MAIQAQEVFKGKFIIATNDIEGSALDNDAIIDLYKGQAISVERGFRFLKDPLFFTSNLFVKKPKRVMSLLMLMGLALLVYSLGEHLLKARLKETHECLPDPTRSTDKHPTLRRLFQMMHGINLVTLKDGPRTITHAKGLTTDQIKILDILGAEFKDCYCLR